VLDDWISPMIVMSRRRGGLVGIAAFAMVWAMVVAGAPRLVVIEDWVGYPLGARGPSGGEAASAVGGIRPAISGSSRPTAGGRST
jgi:hypothetical protein